MGLRHYSKIGQPTIGAIRTISGHPKCDSTLRAQTSELRTAKRTRSRFALRPVHDPDACGPLRRRTDLSDGRKREE